MTWYSIFLATNLCLFLYDVIFSKSSMVMMVGLFLLYISIHLALKRQIQKIQSRQRKVSMDDVAIEKLNFFLFFWNLMFLGYFGWEGVNAYEVMEMNELINEPFFYFGIPKW